MKYLRVSAVVLALQCGPALLRAQSTVTLSPAVSPETGEPGVTNIIVMGYGFPSGSIPPPNVTVTLQPSKPGAGPSGSAKATAVQPLFGSTARVTFTVPASIVVGLPTAYLVSIAGSTSSGAAFLSGNAASLSITPAAQAVVLPNSGVGGAAQVTITGSYTNFLQGSTAANFGPGISVGGAPPGEWGPVTVNSPSSAVAELVIGIPATPGTNAVTIATGTEQAPVAGGFTLAAEFSSLYNFTGGATSGANPKRALVFSGGVLYGTTVAGGASGDGIAFSFTPCADCSPFAILHTFTGFPGDGSAPDGSFAIDSTGVMYGTTGGGGSQPPSGDGTVFSMTPPSAAGGAWTETVLHNFAGTPSDGASPYAGVVIGNGGVLYGTTFYGGPANHGIVFQLTPPASPGGAWTETILHNFAGSPGDGANPHTAVTPGGGGVLYGTTYNGGASGNGMVFQLTPPASAGGAWTETMLHSFAGAPGDGANPHGNLVMGGDGVLYGTALSGGEFGKGMVFSMTPPATPGGAWTETVLYNFAGGADAAEPRAALVIESDGSLYSTTYQGGASGLGAVFSLSPPASPGGAWIETVWHSFSGADGANPEAGLAMDGNGVLYGATFYGGTSNLGAIFSLDP